jgi:hypothetical protein
MTATFCSQIHLPVGWKSENLTFVAERMALGFASVFWGW